jgi:large repetitive protein
MRRIACLLLPLGFLLSACPDDEDTNSDGGTPPATDLGIPDLGVINLPDAAIDCGNGTVEAPEQCDDGNNAPGDGCNAICMIEDGWDCDPAPCAPICGDGMIIGSEACDDGNTANGDGCSDTCTVETRIYVRR